MKNRNLELNYNNYSAADARRIALSVYEAKNDEQLEKVLELINDHSNGGNFVFRMYNEILRDDVKSDLISRGFQIHEIDGGINEKDTIIKW
jgi:hypothetical protein